MTYGNGIQQYNAMNAYTGAAYADPHRLVQLLMNGVLDKMAQAQGAIGRGNISEKGQCFGNAIAIIDGLRATLDKDRGGELAMNMDDLYDYMQRRLLQANMDNDPHGAEEVASLMREIKEAWDAIPDEVRPKNEEALEGGLNAMG